MRQGRLTKRTPTNLRTWDEFTFHKQCSDKEKLVPPSPPSSVSLPPHGTKRCRDCYPFYGCSLARSRVLACVSARATYLRLTGCTSCPTKSPGWSISGWTCLSSSLSCLSWPSASPSTCLPSTRYRCSSTRTGEDREKGTGKGRSSRGFSAQPQTYCRVCVSLR